MHRPLCLCFCALLGFFFIGASGDVQVTDVHIVTMNHLDIGFAQLAYVIINEYFDTYFPNAAVTAQELRNNGTERLIYTTHSWLVDIYVNCAKYAAINALPPGPIHCPNASALALVTNAINQGDISWHGFPFNAQMEFAMNPDFLAAGIKSTHYLDEQFSLPPKGTISQRDVPGTTRSGIPVFVSQGINALTVGVNEASAPPAVPKIFVWQDPVSNQSIIAMWHPGGYGGDSLTDCVTFPNFTHALCWDFRGDNAGPPAIPEVRETFATVEKEFPGANVFASTYDEFIAYVLPLKDQLPVYTGEIGDTWIYGVASDPLKNAYVREIVRARTECVAAKACDPTTFSFHAFDMMLLKNIEHTWALDVKTWLKDTSHYTNQQMLEVINQPNFQIMITSWVEQRNYLTSALNALQKSSFAVELLSRIAIFYNPVVDLSGYDKVDPSQNYSCGRFNIGFDSITGSISYLYDTENDYVWASQDNQIARFLYQTYSQEDFQTFLLEYMREQPPPGWAQNDYGKPNMTNTDAFYLPSLSALFHMQNSSGYYFYSYVTMPADAVTLDGAPKSVYINVFIPANGSTIEINLIWQNKTMTRLPEALYFSFMPDWRASTQYQFNKLGEWISVDEVLLNGSRHLHALQEGARYTDGARSLTVTSLDASVACIGTPTAFPTPLTSFPDPSAGSHFVLYDNLWGTNYIQWYPYLEQDSQQIFRFQLNIV
eukprot:Phypoly_transcript_03985.p1 GENE.Phypoly_transcript_03985~~Phypoly_transcript_03985.p1  ORF type:complete len:714 (+),score=74.06 Phypoly_transcript_03985:89-2230(+)